MELKKVSMVKFVFNGIHESPEVALKTLYGENPTPEQIDEVYDTGYPAWAYWDVEAGKYKVDRSKMGR